ncbi:MAG: MBL fold hydrolase, partial [Candidatus Nephrothrix sp. EaCA]
SAYIEADIIGKTQTKRIVFSGDIGRFEDPVLKPASLPQQADILLIESTYGNRINPMQDVEENLAKIASEALEKGCLAVPAFAVGRTQSLLFYFHKLIREKRIPEVPVFADSPMAINVTKLYEKFPDEHTIRMAENGNNIHNIFDAPFIHFIRSSDESKALNSRKQPCIIVSASGMITGGRIMHHLYHRLRREEDTLLFAGYQAEGSRGRSILDGSPSVRMFGEEVPVKCQVRELHGLSAHADQPELLRWVSEIKDSPKMTFVTHGEAESSVAFSQLLSQKRGWNVSVPNYLDTAVLFDGI